MCGRRAFKRALLSCVRDDLRLRAGAVGVVFRLLCCARLVLADDKFKKKVSEKARNKTNKQTNGSGGGGESVVGWVACLVGGCMGGCMSGWVGG